MPLAAIDAARRRAVLRPLVAVLALSVTPALLLVVPLVGFSRATDPTSIVSIVLMLVAGVALVRVSLMVTRRTLRGVVADGLVRAE